MACPNAIWIRNRRYYNPKAPSTRLFKDSIKSSLAIAPWDVARQFLAVPCGRCPECLRRLRNDWFVRLEREFARCKAERSQAVFVTITIAPQHYEAALTNPTSFIRKWNERVRHKFGFSFKHAFFQEFGLHPEIGSEPRLHFHGVIFGFDRSYNELRAAVSDLGWIWVSSCTHKRLRYVVKYVVKQIHFNPDQIKDKYVTISGKRVALATALLDPIYSRKFISPHVGDYLGRRPRPSARTTTWDYMDFSTGVSYNYKIPRYYDKYLSETDKLVRALASADTYARLYGSSTLRAVVSRTIEVLHPAFNTSYRDQFTWARKAFLAHPPRHDSGPIDLPAWLDFDILDFWSHEYGIDLLDLDPPNNLSPF